VKVLKHSPACASSFSSSSSSPHVFKQIKLSPATDFSMVNLFSKHKHCSFQHCVCSRTRLRAVKSTEKIPSMLLGLDSAFEILQGILSKQEIRRLSAKIILPKTNFQNVDGALEATSAGDVKPWLKDGWFDGVSHVRYGKFSFRQPLAQDGRILQQIPVIVPVNVSSVRYLCLRHSKYQMSLR
jgi:hypothetical protein